MYGNAAVAEFDWHFTAVRRDNGRLTTRQAAKAVCGRRYQTQDGESFMSTTTPVQPKTGVGEALLSFVSGYGADEHSAPVATSSGQLIAFIRHPFCRNTFIIHLQ